MMKSLRLVLTTMAAFALMATTLAQAAGPDQTSLGNVVNQFISPGGVPTRVSPTNPLPVTAGTAAAPSLIDCSSISNVLCGLINGPIPAGTNTIGAVTQVVAEPCQSNAKTWTPINISASGTNTTPIVAGTSAKKTYICQIVLVNNAADNVAVVEATTGTSCGTVTAGIWGGTTAAAGFNFAANGGVSIGNGGYFVGKTATNNNDVCIITSAATQLTGGMLSVQQ